MNKKLKIIISVILFFVTIVITTSSFAGVNVPRTAHYDKWTGRKQFFAYKEEDPTKDDEGKPAKWATICAEKMGALRFTPSGFNISEYPVDGGYSTTIHEDCLKKSSSVGQEFLKAEKDLKQTVLNKINNLSGAWASAVRIGDYFDYYDGGYNVQKESENLINGIIGVSDPFCVTATYKPSGQAVVNTNDLVSYILSSGSYAHPTAFGLKQGNYNESTVSTRNDVDAGLIQGALWNTNGSQFNVGKQQNYGGTIKELYNEANEYQNYYNTNLKNGYNANFIDESSAKVIVDQETGKYTIGPYKVQYPDNTKFSYIQEIYLKNQKGEEINTRPRVICNSGNYPVSGESFFLEFNAQESGNPTKVSVVVEFAYLYNTTSKYQKYEAEDQPIYQLVGKRITKHTVQRCKRGYETKRVWDEETEQMIDVPDYDKPIYGDCDVYEYSGKIEVKKVGTYDSQVLVEVLDVSREWKEASIKTSSSLDLRMKLGGRVFEDSNSGKISDVDGIYKTKKDKPMPNVQVSLYNLNGLHIGSTITDKNGNYEFTNLDAMSKYYVKFTYNGQYYEPTKYSGTNTWGTSEWKNNSNGVDKINERMEFNKRFQTIESSPQNYKSTTGQYNETYSKKELLGYTLNELGEYVKTKTPVIDEFGNLILESSNDAELVKKIQFVKDCLMNSYTYNQEQNKMDLYPVVNQFIISDTGILDRSLLGGQTLLYDDAQHINQGLSKRHEVDLALIKDVEKVTLEINGQTHTYNYDNLDKSRCTTHNWEGKNQDIQVVYNMELGRNVKLCRKCIENLNKNNIDVRTLPADDVCEIEQLWDIDMRLSDAKYYNTEYTRELYKSDYLYNVENVYGNYADYGKTKDDELKVYITYKLMIYNHSMSINTKVEEIVDYYDDDLRYVPNRSYITIGSSQEHLPVDANYNANTEASTSKYAQTMTKVNGYRDLYIQGLDDRYLLSEETAYVYLTFEVEKENNGLVKLDQDIYVENGQIVYKDRQTGKENIAEINGYTTRYADGVQIPNIGDVSQIGYIAGIIDRDSKPGNIKAEYITNKNYEKFEDDTDEAPNISIKLYQDDDKNARVISGVVWEDERTKTNEALKTTTGDGKRSDEETLINGVTVQLVELMDNGTEYVWREFGDNTGNGGGINTIGKGTGSGTRETETPIINAKVGEINLIKDYDFGENKEGAYAFKSFAPGKYVIRFIYGDTTRTVTPESFALGGLNKKSYNGQDYKSTAYQSEVTTNAQPYHWYRVTGIDKGNVTGTRTIATVPTYDKNQCSQNETVVRNGTTNGYLHDIKTLEQYANVSDAKDIASSRETVNSYSAINVTNYIAEVLASHKEDYNTMNDRSQLLGELMKNTKMTSETGLMVIEFEKVATNSDGNYKDNTYHIANIDLGLEERPKAQLAVDKEVTNVKLTLADGSILFDAKDTATNVLWRDHKKYDTAYTNKYFMDPDKFGNIENIRNENASKFGLIQLSMDEELMHGATMEVTYQINVTNVGEVDYKDNKFYYTGDGVLNNNSIVTTSANQVIDYVANNLQFNKSNNNNWNTIKDVNIFNEQNTNASLVHANLKTELEKYNTIITTESLNKALKPAILGNGESTTSTPLVLTQLITTENDTDDLTYENIVEIVKTSNTVGRRMEYSVVGNQNPSEEPEELDSDKAEVVKILPPFGNAGIYIIIAIITIAAVGVIITGIIFIKKKVLTK